MSRGNTPKDRKETAMNEKMPRTPLSTQLSGSARETEIRIRNIFSGPKKRPPLPFLILMFSICIFCGNLVSCQVKEAEGPEAEVWVDYFDAEEMPWDETAELRLEEYPGVTFRWTTSGVTAKGEAGTTVLIGGMPVWNVFLCDLNGDGKRELCATSSFGSGIVDNHIEVYDYAAGQWYILWDRMEYDYALSLEDGQLRVSQWEYQGGPPSQGEPLSTGGLTLSSDSTREGEWFIAQPAGPFWSDDPDSQPPGEDSMPFDQPLEMEFCSGAGGWWTALRIHPDGSFEGDYHDADMGDGGENYPHGTEYVCPFHGSFRDIVQLTDSSWSLTLEELVLDTGHPVGEEWIEDGVRYVSSEPYGFNTPDGKALEPGAQFTLYSPEAKGYVPTDDLYGMNGEDENSPLYEFWTWWPNRRSWDPDITLDCWGLHNLASGQGFFS